MTTPTLTELACAVLNTADGREKTRLSHEAATLWFDSVKSGRPLNIGNSIPPDHPRRPKAPLLLPPNKVPRRRTGTHKGRMALLHSIAHIELNAVDLHWEILPRFAHIDMPIEYYNDWVQAAKEEAKHFNLLCDRLEAHGSFYGEMPAHDGMWRAAAETAHDFSWAVLRSFLWCLKRVA